MCGRAYETYTDEELAIQYLNGQPPNLDWMRPNFNMAPTQNSPVVVVRDGEPAVDRFRWGLIPFWAKSVAAAAKYSLINARGEEITEKRSYAIAFKRRRCVVPLSGFYEWKREGKTKRPFAIQLRDHPIMSVAGVWERWQPGDDTEPVHSFSIVTTRANTFIADIHDRILPLSRHQNTPSRTSFLDRCRSRTARPSVRDVDEPMADAGGKQTAGGLEAGVRVKSGEGVGAHPGRGRNWNRTFRAASAVSENHREEVRLVCWQLGPGGERLESFREPGYWGAISPILLNLTIPL